MTNLEVKEKVEGARTRSNIYGFLSSMFREEINAERLLQIKGPDIKEVLSEMGIQYEIFSQKDQDQLLEDLAVEYTRLFLGPDKHISPHEAVHHQRDDGDWGVHWGGSTVDVKKFIETTGLEYKQEYSGMPDHISVELDFMKEAAGREAQAIEEKDWEGALYCQKMEKKFICDHLIKWIPTFCDKIISQAEISFYGDLADVTKDFITLEFEEINESISETEGQVN
ncbi:MAG: molecular chaperone TorD family protein [Desulfobacterales bacterium]|nr:molecular chaperone TorD family protein [Desulfobacterales bacterium]